MQISNKKIKTKQTKVKQVQSNSSSDSAWSSWPTSSSSPSPELPLVIKPSTKFIQHVFANICAKTNDLLNMYMLSRPLPSLTSLL